MCITDSMHVVLSLYGSFFLKSMHYLYVTEPCQCSVLTPYGILIHRSLQLGTHHGILKHTMCISMTINASLATNHYSERSANNSYNEMDVVLNIPFNARKFSFCKIPDTLLVSNASLKLQEISRARNI